MRGSISSGRPVSGLRLNSPGGSLLEGVRLAGVIQNAKIATVIASGATCAAACFIAFIAGNQKFVSATATVGVPGAANRLDAAGDVPAIVRVVKELGLLDAIVEKMLAARDDDIVAAAQIFATENLVRTQARDIRKTTAPCEHLGLFMGADTLVDIWPGIVRWLSCRTAQPLGFNWMD